MVVPRPDYAHAASVAAAFFTAWASIDTVHDRPDAFLGRCALLVTPALRRQLGANQPASAEWQLMRHIHLISLVHVEAVTSPAGAPPPTAARTYQRVYTRRLTTTTGRTTASSDGITLQLTRADGRWLVARLLPW